jgi:hypothetical protein
MCGIADPFNGHIDEVRISHVQRSDGWIEATRNNTSDPMRSQRLAPRSRKAAMASRHRSPAPMWSSASWGEGRTFSIGWDNALVTCWSANPLGMLWPEMDAALVASYGRNSGPPAAARRPVVVAAAG